MAGAGGKSNEPETSEALTTFGVVLKALRERAGLTQEEFATRVQYSAHYIASIEQGRRFPPQDLVDRGEEVLASGGVLKAVASHVTRRVGLAAWFREWATIELDAISLYAYECRVLPGLLQPEAYIRAIIEGSSQPPTEEQIEHRVKARLERQRLLHERPSTTFSFVFEQSLLERSTGGREVTRIVIEHLLAVGRQRNVEIQVMPTEQPTHAGMNGPMYLAETSDHRWIGYTEGLGYSTLISNPKSVSAMMQAYGKLRSQALGSAATLSLLENMLGKL